MAGWRWRAFGQAVVSLALLWGGCAEGDAGPDAGRPDVSHLDGGAIYAAQCASCHGEVGEGGLGPSLVDWSRGEDALIDIIDVRMPQTNPAACDEACATAVGRYVIATFTSEALACDEITPGPRQLRLLTRREYRNTIYDLFPTLAPGAEAAADPGATEPCGLTHFRYDPGGRSLSSVSVAGSFNAWSPTAWPMSLDASGVWVLDQTLAEGTHQYKLVLDGSEWVTDPSNSDHAADGFGGQNSVIVVSCSSTSPAPSTTAGLTDPADGFPVETRPDGFPFDDHAESGRVTPVHAEEQLRAAARVATALGDGIADLAPCDLAEGASCAEAFARDFGARVFRRPLEDREVTRYAALVTGAATPAEGLGIPLRAMLVSPAFLYRSEVGEAQDDGTFALTGWEIASALSYGIWGTMPDEALFDAAADGSLETDEGITREAQRLLADPRAGALLGEVGIQWLGVEAIADKPKSNVLFPDFDDALRASMLEETRRFVAHVVLEGSGRFDELLTADYTFADARLARHYGIGGVDGDTPTLTPTAPERAAGVLGHASVLARYAHSDQSSPIQRGVFVRRRILCQDFAPPPPNAGGVPDVDPEATTRERFAQHTADTVCRGCHQYIDEVGFGFESFDAVGAFRTTDQGRPVDSHGDMGDVEGMGTNTSAPFSTLPELGQILAESDAAEACFVRQYTRYARGMRERAEDRCALLDLAERFSASGGDIRTLIVDTYLSPAFRRRK